MARTAAGWRILPSIRLSRDTDATNSPETQKADIADWVEDQAAPHVLLDWVYDLDVSGGIPIRSREGIGPHLSGDGLNDWDAIAGRELDRLFRDMRDFVNFARDMRDQHRKWIIDVSDGTDTSTQRGMQILEDRALAAERERLRMSERRSRAARKIRADGRWNGGLPPFGYMPVEDAKGWRLVPDPLYHPILLRMVDDYLDGASLNAIAQWLNDEGIPTPTDIARARNPKMTPRGIGWKPASVRAVLKGRAMTGVMIHDGQVVRGADGMPIMRAEPLVEYETWLRLQAALESRKGRSVGPRRARLLLQVAFCLTDRQPYYGHSSRHLYYACRNASPNRGAAPRCVGQMIRADWFESVSTSVFLAEVGDVEIEERAADASDGTAAELAEIGRAIVDLTADQFGGGSGRDDYDQVMGALRARHAELSSQPARPRTAIWRGTGRTYSQMWDSLGDDIPRRRALMVGAGFRMYAKRDGDQTMLMHEIDPDLARRAGLAASGKPVAVPAPRAPAAWPSVAPVVDLAARRKAPTTSTA